MKLTAATVRTLALPAGVTDKIFFDDELPRFGVRMRAGGSRTWIVQYGIGGKERKLPLGPVSALDPSKARALAKDVLARVRLGEDPLALKHEAAARASETLGAQLPRYLAFKRASLRPRSYAQVERHLLVHAKPLHGRPLVSLASDRRSVAVVLAKVAETSGPVEANMVRSSLSACCRWLMGDREQARAEPLRARALRSHQFNSARTTCCKTSSTASISTAIVLVLMSLP